jgi:hypothetical protein
MSERKKKNDAKKAEKTAEKNQKRSKVQHLMNFTDNMRSLTDHHPWDEDEEQGTSDDVDVARYNLASGKKELELEEKEDPNPNPNPN